MTSNTLSPATSEEIINLDEELEASEFEVHWRHLNYTVNNSLSTRIAKRIQGFSNVPKSKTILDNVSGTVKSGELVAFMGPSGAGKTTLMECVVGRRVKGRTGDAFICGKNLNKIKVAFIGQTNNFLTQLTVRETITFAAKIKIATKAMHGIVDPLFDEDGKLIMTQAGSSEYCKIMTDRIITDFGLQSCENNRVSTCSGGERKRLAVAQEIVGKPRILVLDEPTSGLDSSSALQVIELLRNLCESKLKITVLASIHQPSYKVLTLFHKLFVLSSNGDIIYDNSPLNLGDQLTKIKLKCPTNCNPGDLIMEVASGEHGDEVLQKLVSSHRQQHDNFEVNEYCKPLTQLNEKQSFPNLHHAWILFQRNNIITFRDPMVFWFRLATTIGVPLFLTSLFGTKIGLRGGCPPKFDAEFEPSQLDYIGDEIEAEIKSTYMNAGNIFFATLFAMFNSLMSTCLGFPGEMVVMKVEKYNLWYSVNAFCFGKTLSELPFQIMFVLLFWPLQHVLQNQTPDAWRIATICFVLFLVQFISQSTGYITAAIFMNNVAASVFLGPAVCIIPFMLLSGLFVKIKNLNTLFSVMSYFSYIRFAIEAIFVLLYGFGVCGHSKSDLKEGREAFIVWFSAMLGVYGDGNEKTTSDYISVGSPSEKFVEGVIDTLAGDFMSKDDEVRSSVMNIFELEDWFLTRAIVVMTVYAIVARGVSVAVIRLMVKTKN